MTRTSTRGFTLIELVVAITMVGICATTILTLMTSISARSAGVLVQQQAAVIANAYIEEATSKPFAVQPGGGARANLNDVADYNFTDVGARDQSGNLIAGLNAYRVQIVTQPGGIAGIPANQVYRIVVTVTDPRNQSLSVTAFKLSP
jgi:prepilin-type N-terminal cleavage/methylation domain-containing protein